MIAKRLKMFEFDMKKRLIYECDDFIAVLKYSGESYHNDNEDEIGFFNMVRDELKRDIYSVHRLDKDTSGIMLFAKTPSAQKELLHLFKERRIEKTYFALSDKKPKKKMGNIIGDLVSTRGGNYKLTHEKSNPAITRFNSYKGDSGLFFFRYFPKTGRTHQLRVVAKSLGASILGDKRYGGSEYKRMMLHCYKLVFKWKDEDLTIISIPSEDEFMDFSAYFNAEMK